MESLVFKIAVIGALGVGAQWIAWRFRLPAIVLLLGAGLLAGPFTGVIDPQADFGELLRPLVSVAVAIILFEGGLTLNFAEIRETSKAVRRIVAIGAPIAFGLGALAARFIADLSWPTALVFAGILVVTGPTVIMPLLRQARLSPRPASLLRWEAIIADPVGALLAVMVFEGFLVFGGSHEIEAVVFRAALAGIVALGGGYALGRLLVNTFIKGYVAEFLKVPVIFCTVLGAYAVSDLILEESGLLTVTVLGVTLANSRIASLSELRRFKEIMTVLLVSGVFVLLTATLTIDHLKALDWRAFGFIAVLLVVVRPISVFLSTIGAGLTFRERLLVGWIAPRGVVAVAVSGLFGAALVAHGVEDGGRLIALAFAIVFTTVVLHGFSMGPLARWLGLASGGQEGVLIVGASPWAVAFAKKIRELGLPVVIADRNWNRLKDARLADVPVYYGEILSEAAEHHIDFNRFGYLVAASDNDAYNALICTDFGPELGRGNVFQIGRRSGKERGERGDLAVTLGGRDLLADVGGHHALNTRLSAGWAFQATRISAEYAADRFWADRPKGTAVVLVGRGGKRLIWPDRDSAPKLQQDDIVLSFGPKPESGKVRSKSDAEGIPNDNDPRAHNSG